MRRVPTHLKLLRGNPGKRAIPPEPEPDLPEGMPEPPAFLMPTARDEWWSTGVQIYRLGLLRGVDLNVFASYCQSVARWKQAEEALIAMAAKDPVTGALLIKRADGNPGINPLLRATQSAAKLMLELASEFGLTPLARSRIGGGVGGYQAPSSSKFDGLLKG